MVNQALIASLLKFLIRRGLSMLGTAGMAVSDDWVTQAAAIVLLIGNEIYQWWQSHKAEQHKQNGTYTP